jgi:hypothetical protein
MPCWTIVMMSAILAASLGFAACALLIVGSDSDSRRRP